MYGIKSTFFPGLRGSGLNCSREGFFLTGSRKPLKKGHSSAIPLQESIIQKSKKDR